MPIGTDRRGVRDRYDAWHAQHEVVADFSCTAVEMGGASAASRGVDQMTWTIADIEEPTRLSPGFGAVISCETIEHVPSRPSRSGNSPMSRGPEVGCI